MQTNNPPLSYHEVSNRLELTGAHYAGVREIPLDRIVGSVARNAGFDRQFRPLRRDAPARPRSLADAFPNNDFPPIAVYEVGGSYFVVDGHHRVALSRERGIAFIAAEVNRIDTPYELPPDADVCQLVHTEQQRILMEDSGLARTRPEAVIEFSRVEGYPELLELVKAHGYDLMRARGRLLDPAEIAADWYDTVYCPGLAALRREQLPAAYAYKTDADLFLWIYRQRRALAAVDTPSTSEPQPGRRGAGGSVAGSAAPGFGRSGPRCAAADDSLPCAARRSPTMSDPTTTRPEAGERRFILGPDQVRATILTTGPRPTAATTSSTACCC